VDDDAVGFDAGEVYARGNGQVEAEKEGEFGERFAEDEGCAVHQPIQTSVAGYDHFGV
jgi:hypothetical protein